MKPHKHKFEYVGGSYMPSPMRGKCCKDYFVCECGADFYIETDDPEIHEAIAWGRVKWKK